MVNQEGDLALFNNMIAGDIFVENGEPKMEQGLETSIFISLFSGEKYEFWANELVDNTPSYQFGGEFENMSKQLILTVQNCLRLEEYAKRDLQWLIDENIAQDIIASITIISSIRFLLEISIIKIDESIVNFKYDNNWQGQFLN